jgi:SPP1 gp7 family putative phage head morphogenesis protein
MSTIEALGGDVSEAEFKSAVLSSIQDSVPAGWETPEAQRQIIESTNDIYEYYRLEDTSVFDGQIEDLPNFRFTGADRRTMRFVSKVDNFFFSGYVDNSDFQEPFKDFLHDVFGEGLPEFNDEIRDKFKGLFAGKLDDLTDAQVRRIVETSAARMRNWAQIEQLHEAGIEEARVVAILDSKTSQICRFMNGRIISISDAVGAVRSLSKLAPTEFKQHFYESDEGKSFNSDPVAHIRSQGVSAAVASGRGVPPYHAHCRTDLVYHYEDSSVGPTASMSDNADGRAGSRAEEMNELTPYELDKQVETMRLSGWSIRNPQQHFGKHAGLMGYGAGDFEKYKSDAAEVLTSSTNIVTFIHASGDRQWKFFGEINGRPASVTISEETGRIVTFHRDDPYHLRSQDVGIDYGG